MKKILIPFILLLVGCANPGIVKLSPDTYMLFREDHGGIFGSSSSLKAGVISDANKFAAKQGKVVIPITSNFKPMGNGPAQWASFEYQFRVVNKNDPEARRTSLTPRADIVIEKNEKITADIKTEEKTNKTKDIYNELIKLDDLRKKGIITDKEFQTRKNKILNEN
ncbi:MAG: SHOCT domain-containing protein [Gammaproteobacteria bacterium]|nr:SHOCT domain-containing protein [Gammaproteobacteria bacterium]